MEKNKIKFEIKVDSSDERVLELIDKLLENDEFQKQFEREPKRILDEYGIDLPEEFFKEGIDLQGILTTMGGEYQALRVKAGVTAATRPAVRAAVRVVVVVTVAPAPAVTTKKVPPKK